MIEERISQCETEHDLILQSGPISDMIMKVEKVVTSCQKLEERLNLLLDRGTLINFAAQVIQIISSNITDTEVLDQIATEIEQAITSNE